MTQKILFFTLALLCVTVHSTGRLLQKYDDPNCSEWSDDGLTCQKCAVRTYFDSSQNKCIPVDPTCKTWSQTNGECLTCFDGYGDAFRNGNAINGTCPLFNDTEPNPPPFEYDINCKCYSDELVCLECYQFYDFDANGRCQSTQEGCLRFVNDTCEQCQLGFYLTIEGTCAKLSANCLKGDVNGNCTECAAGYFLISDGTCLILPANCISLDSVTGYCNQCSSRYYLDQQSNCKPLPQNCVEADTKGKCLACEDGYALDQKNQCQVLPDNCFFTDTNGICTECVDGYYLDSNKECNLLPPNCLNASQNGECTECKENFQLVNGECKVQIPIGKPNPDCAEQNNQSECTKCRNFYTLKQGKCIPTGQNPFCAPGSCECGTGKCLQCIKGYFLDNNNICTVIAQNCKQYSRLNGKCTSCIQKYELVDGECVPQKEQITNLNCKEQTQNGTCTSCRKYYKLVDGDCIPTGQNPKCHYWSKQKVCQCCYYHQIYYLDNNNICQVRNRHCHQFDPQNGQCTSCIKNFELSEGKCHKKK